ncbi:MAG: hypothetical protein MK165_21160, partial [Pirellulaceae bacterium]|nr:hypothetical protein [Pirellulaceae bacterium]
MFRRLGKGLLASGAFILFSCVTRGETAEAPAFDAAAIEFFEAKVRPILVTRCYECHSAKAKAPKGGLRLDSRAHILRGGESGPAVSLDEGEVSRFIEAINYGDL